MGARKYSDYVEWGEDIHITNRKEIDAILKIPTPLRTQWGIYKNLLSGITTVVHHGDYLAVPDPLIDVFQKCNMIHSARQERRWRWKLNKPFAMRAPIVVHAGEGTNAQSRREVDSLIRWNLFEREMIAVHGVAMEEEQADRFAALIWCPDSNYYLFDRTAEISRLRRRTKILFGTDSTLSASWNIWEHLRFARKLGAMPDEALFDSVTCAPAESWRLQGKGRLTAGSQADIVVANRRGSGGVYDSWFEINPADIALVMQNGAVRLCDEDRCRQLSGSQSAGFSQIRVDGSAKYVQGDLPQLMSAIKGFAPQVRFPIESAI